jgi:hypothetical protein
MISAIVGMYSVWSSCMYFALIRALHVEQVHAKVTMAMACHNIIVWNSCYCLAGWLQILRSCQSYSESGKRFSEYGGDQEAVGFEALEQYVQLAVQEASSKLNRFPGRDRELAWCGTS